MTDGPDPSEEVRDERSADVERLLRPDLIHLQGGVRHVIDWDGGIGTCPFCREVYYCCRCGG